MDQHSYRRQFHFFNRLKYWEDYEKSFNYLDSKGRGLVSASSIFAAVYLFVLDIQLSRFPSEGGFWSVPLYWIMLLTALATLLAIGVAILMLFRCFRTTADRRYSRHRPHMEQLEKAFTETGLHQLEAQIDRFVELHIASLVALRSERAKAREKLEAFWTENGVRNRTLDEALGQLEMYFRLLRVEVEGDIHDRHVSYRWAKRIMTAVLLVFVAYIGALLAEVVAAMMARHG
ncbi:hypothetical protein [Roseivivax sp. CAU 1761]